MNFTSYILKYSLLFGAAITCQSAIASSVDLPIHDVAPVGAGIVAVGFAVAVVGDDPADISEKTDWKSGDTKSFLRPSKEDALRMAGRISGASISGSSGARPDRISGNKRSQSVAMGAGSYGGGGGSDLVPAEIQENREKERQDHDQGQSYIGFNCKPQGVYKKLRADNNIAKQKELEALKDILELGVDDLSAPSFSSSPVTPASSPVPASIPTSVLALSVPAIIPTPVCILATDNLDETSWIMFPLAGD
jgi:hypothetical protein